MNMFILFLIIRRSSYNIGEQLSDYELNAQSINSSLNLWLGDLEHGI